MTDIIFAVIDNHKKHKHTKYDCLYKSRNIEDFENYLIEKGLK